MIGQNDIVMLCILKQVDMIRQVQKAVDEGIPTKITIENFQKRSGTIYTSDRTTVELDNEVIKLLVCHLKKLNTVIINNNKYSNTNICT